MSIKIGDIDLVDSVINTEFRVAVLEKILDKVLRTAPPGTLTQFDVETIRSQTFEELKKKYPMAGLTKK